MGSLINQLESKRKHQKLDRIGQAKGYAGRQGERRLRRKARMHDEMARFAKRHVLPFGIPLVRGVFRKEGWKPDLVVALAQGLQAFG